MGSCPLRKGKTSIARSAPDPTIVLASGQGLNRTSSIYLVPQNHSLRDLVGPQSSSSSSSLVGSCHDELLQPPPWQRQITIGAGAFISLICPSLGPGREAIAMGPRPDPPAGQSQTIAQVSTGLTDQQSLAPLPSPQDSQDSSGSRLILEDSLARR
ncbi:hypothetical protein NL676_008906 [Syzygium grande]|nr:hypothetical protein NL676_008906 [Syzygium grande]